MAFPKDLFEIQIIGAERKMFRVIARSAEGDAQVIVTPPQKLKPDLLILQKALTRGVSRGRGNTARVAASAEKLIQEYGTKLFSFVFDGKVEALYRSTLLATERMRPEQALRVKLRIEADELSYVPWETLYDTEKHLHIAPSLKTLLLRGTEMEDTGISRPPPLRILGMIARPSQLVTEQGTFALGAIDAEREQADIAEALEELENSGKITLSWTKSGSWDELERRFVKPDFEEGWTIFHFIGHGDFDPRKGNKGSGFLIFEAVGGGADLAYADDLASFLDTPNAPTLVVLNACNGAYSAAGDLFSSTASRLVSSGIPAVVAMQFPITDDAAKKFSVEFYSKLAQGLPIHRALSLTRMNLKRSGFSEWISPVLYMRNSSGKIFVDTGHSGDNS